MITIQKDRNAKISCPSAISNHFFTISLQLELFHENNKKDLLAMKRSQVCMIGAGEGNRTLIISLEG
jgi:hypothetical protein